MRSANCPYQPILSIFYNLSQPTYSYRLYHPQATSKIKDDKTTNIPPTYFHPTLAKGGQDAGEPYLIPTPPHRISFCATQDGKEDEEHTEGVPIPLDDSKNLFIFYFFPAVCCRTIWFPTLQSCRYATSSEDMGRPVLSEPSRKVRQYVVNRE